MRRRSRDRPESAKNAYLPRASGDLGTAAETLAAAERGRAASILYVFDELRNIARIAGKGSQAEKCKRVARVLSGASPIEAKGRTMRSSSARVRT
ncbi:MAG: hypothetical protein ACLQF1_21235 [Methyloceanibacter sp.]